MTKRQIKFTLTDEDIQYLKDTKNDFLLYADMENNMFGDEFKYKKYQAFNKLEDWEKNLLLLWVKYESVEKVATMLNVEKSTTSNVLKEIKKKMRNILC